MTAPSVVSPAELAAASLCWLSRFKSALPDGPGTARIADKVESYWHNKPCRYCPVKAEALMLAINGAWEDLYDERGNPTVTLTAFEALKPNARTAKVREAQEETWYDEIARTS